MKVIMAIIINGCLLMSSLNYFNVREMSQGDYLVGKSYQIEAFEQEYSTLKINLRENVSEKFTSEYLESQFEIKNYIEKGNEIDSAQITNYLSKFFAVEIKNSTDKDFSISNDLGLPVIQEAKDKNGEWRPIEYIMLNGSLLSHTIELQTKSIIEIAAPRYSGDYETELRLKIAIQKYGTLTSPSFRGTINYSQFEMPETEEIKSRIYFLE